MGASCKFWERVIVGRSQQLFQIIAHRYFGAEAIFFWGTQAQKGEFDPTIESLVFFSVAVEYGGITFLNSLLDIVNA